MNSIEATRCNKTIIELMQLRLIKIQILEKNYKNKTKIKKREVNEGIGKSVANHVNFLIG